MNATRYDETDLHHVGLVANKVFCILDCGPEQLVYTANSDTPYGPLLRDLSVGPLVVKLEPGPDGGILDPLPMAPIAAVNADLTIAVSLSGSEAGGRYEPTESEPRATTEWLNRMWRSTSSLLDTNAARSFLDTQSARAMLSRFDSAPEDMDDGDPEIKPESDEESVPSLGSFEVMNAPSTSPRPRWPTTRWRPTRPTS